MNIFKGYIVLTFIAILTVAVPGVSYSQNSSDKGDLRLKTVVIDAGHGGKDAGAVSKDRKTYEKNLTLSIALLLGKKIEAAYPDVKVMYTRSTDKFVELGERAAIANRNKADLFISVHINSAEAASAHGYSAHILGQSSSANRDLFSANLELSKRENSVILLEEDYDTKYQGFDPSDPESQIFFNLMQNAYYEQSILFAAEVTEALSKGPFRRNRGISQNPFLVLWKTTMPAVLCEMGFISNTEDLATLNSSQGREKIAAGLFNAFKSFKEKYDGSLHYERAESPASVESGPDRAGLTAGSLSSDSVALSAGGPVLYGIQIMTLSRELALGDKALKGWTAEIFPSGNLYKYVVEISENENEARRKFNRVKKNFPDAYLVKIVNGEPAKL